jgi:hypothetical protein
MYPLIGLGFLTLGRVARKIPQPAFNGVTKRRREGAVRCIELHRAGFQEKSLSITNCNPYRKPKQVIGSRRARRTSEGPSRNSAKKQP